MGYYYYRMSASQRVAVMGGILPFVDDFDRSNGGLGDPWESGGATWAIASNEAVNTPTEGTELVANGDFSAWTLDDPDDWTVTGEVGADPEVSEVGTGQGHGGAGTGLCNLYSSATNFQPLLRQAILTAADWYVVKLTIDTRNSGLLQYFDGTFNITWNSTGNKIFTYRALGAVLGIRGNVAATDITFDDVSVKALTLNTLFTDVDDAATADVVAEVELDTVVAETQAGLVLNLDDKDTPANFVIAYHDGTNAMLEKCVAGTYTTVISAAAAYAAGATLVVIKDGTSYSLYYNDAQVGTTSTISDAGIISNTKHGLFSTYSGNQLDDFSVEAN